MIDIWKAPNIFSSKPTFTLVLYVQWVQQNELFCAPDNFIPKTYEWNTLISRVRSTPMSFSLQDYCCIVGKFVFYHPSHCLCPSCPAICYLHQTIFSPVDQQYSVPTIPHEFQYPRISISSIFVVCFYRGWLSGRVFHLTRCQAAWYDHNSKPGSIYWNLSPANPDFQ